MVSLIVKQIKNYTYCPEVREVIIAGALELAKLGLIPHFTSADIEERSNADVIMKMVVLAQITWFGLQVLGRLTSHVPVTLLETHTTAHVGCTILIYLLWMKKPYDVRFSNVLREPRARDMGALFTFSRTMTEKHTQLLVEFQSARVQYWKDRVGRAANNLHDYDPPPMSPLKEPLTTAIERYTDLASENSLTEGNIDPRERKLMTIAASAKRAVEMLKIKEGLTKKEINNQNWDFLRDNSENLAVRQVWGSWSTDIGHEFSSEKGLHFLFNFLYGGAHIAALSSSSFPTKFEQWLRRGSAIVLTSMPLWGTIWILWWKAVSSKRKLFYPIHNGDFDIVAAPFFVTVLLAYFAARAFLLIESLISLRSLPAGAFVKGFKWL